MTTITDKYMRQMSATTRNYCIVILKSGPNRHREDAGKIIWEHGRKNYQLRAEGVLAIVCPVTDDSDVAGIGIFNASVEHTQKIMEEDPAIQTGILTYELHTCRSFPGDSLPGV